MGDTTNTYGVINTNTITPEIRARQEQATETVDLEDKRLARITRLRLVTDRDFPLWDVSYCYGELRDGTPVRVQLPYWQFGKKTLKAELVSMCRARGLYAKGLGLLDEDVLSKLYG